MADELQRYEPIRKLAPGLSVVDGEWYDTPFKRRMTVVETEAGDAILHSPVRMRDDDVAQLETRARVRWIVAPNRFHSSEAGWYGKRFPAAQVLVPRVLFASRGAEVPSAQTLEDHWPRNAELSCIPVQGLRFLGESVFIHHPTRTLILTDLAFNMGVESKGLERAFMKWNRVYNCFGPSRIFETVFVGNRKAFRQSLETILAEDFDRVIMSHGTVVERDGKTVFRKGFARFL